MKCEICWTWFDAERAAYGWYIPTGETLRHLLCLRHYEIAKSCMPKTWIHGLIGERPPDPFEPKLDILKGGR